MTTSEGAPNSRLGKEELSAYWSGLSERFLPEDPQGLSVICYAGMPTWFNGFLDRYQRMAFSRLTRGMDFGGRSVLDLGTGIGRWARWFAVRGASDVVGVDLDGERLSAARSRSRGLHVDYEQMSVDNLTLPADSFDVVNSVTVLQHVDREVKLRALSEMSRVLRPNGYVTLFEITDMGDDASHVFPESQEAWEEMCSAQGLTVVRSVGDQYTPLIRLAKAAFNRKQVDAFKAKGPDDRSFSPAALALRALVFASYPIEEFCQRFVPSSSAKITGFLLQKQVPATSESEEREVAA